MRVFPLTNEIITDSQLHEQFAKHAITKSDESSCEIFMSVFSNGSLEHSLKFLMIFKQVMTDMNLDTKVNGMCREFRDHTRGSALSRFNSIYDQQMVDLPVSENLTPEHLKTIIAHAITGFGRTNRLKCIKLHMSTVSKPHGTSQDTFMERTHVMQNYLQLLNHYFPAITSLNIKDFKDAHV